MSLFLRSTKHVEAIDNEKTDTMRKEKPTLLNKVPDPPKDLGGAERKMFTNIAESLYARRALFDWHVIYIKKFVGYIADVNTARRKISRFMTRPQKVVFNREMNDDHEQVIKDAATTFGIDPEDFESLGVHLPKNFKLD